MATSKFTDHPASITSVIRCCFDRLKAAGVHSTDREPNEPRPHEPHAHEPRPHEPHPHELRLGVSWGWSNPFAGKETARNAGRVSLPVVVAVIHPHFGGRIDRARHGWGRRRGSGQPMGSLWCGQLFSSCGVALSGEVTVRCRKRQARLSVEARRVLPWVVPVPSR
jgi:hypothetical protein